MKSGKRKRRKWRQKLEQEKRSNATPSQTDLEDSKQTTQAENKVGTLKQPRLSTLPQRAKPLGKRFSSWLVGGIALVASVATLWQMRPVLSASASYSTTYPGPFPTLFAVTNAGQLPIYDIEASSYPAYIMFSDGDALKFSSHTYTYFPISGELTSGESGTNPIGQMIRMFKASGKLVIAIGDISGKQEEPTFIIHLHTSMSQSSKTLFGQEGRLQLVGTNEESIAFVDLLTPVRFKPWLFPKVNMKFRFFGERDPQNKFSWYSVALTQQANLNRATGDVVELSDEALPDDGVSQHQFRTP